MNHYYQKIKTEIGTLHLVSDETHLRVLAFNANWEKLKKKLPKLIHETSAVIEKTAKQLNEYFAGKRTEFTIPFKLEGTEFQKKVWESLAHIPYGKTSSYQAQAEKLKMPKAIRAVARTNGLNPISVILPCHRVIGKNGKLTGYAGGLPAKEFLLKRES